MIRTGAPPDRQHVIRMLRDAHTAGGLPFPFSAPHAAALFDSHVSTPSLLALIHEANGKPGGILLASSQLHPFAPIKYAAEVVWWIEPEHRGKCAGEMLAAYEAWAVEQGCAFASMAALAAAPRAGVIYRRRGYREAETHFLKSLAPLTAA